MADSYYNLLLLLKCFFMKTTKTWYGKIQMFVNVGSEAGK